MNLTTSTSNQEYSTDGCFLILGHLESKKNSLSKGDFTASIIIEDESSHESIDGDVRLEVCVKDTNGKTFEEMFDIKSIVKL